MPATRDVEVRILSDAAQLERTLAKSSTLLARFGGDAEKAAQATVAAGTKQREGLEQLAAAYQHTADSAEKGSNEQIVAAEKAAEAQRRLGTQVKTTAAESDTAFKGATSSAVGFAKQAAFFGAGFLGFEGLKQSIDVVLASQESLEKLDKAIVNAHADVAAITPILDRYQASAEKLGFTDDQTREAQQELITAFGATKQSLAELKDAEDLAREKNMDLATSAKTLILLQEGNTRAAKQFGLALPDLTADEWKHKAALDGITVSQEKGKVLYDELLPRIKNQAAAFANSPSGKIAEFHAEIQRLEEGIGEGLLPTVDDYLTKVDAWLAKDKNQQRVTDDVRQAVHTLAGVLEDAKGATHDVLVVANPLANALGGWKTVIEALIALKFASVLQGWTTSTKALIGVKGGEGLLGAETAAGGLLGKLKAIAAMRLIQVAIVIKAVNALTGSHGIDMHDDLQDAIPKKGSKNPYAQGTSDYFEWEAGFYGAGKGKHRVFPGGGGSGYVDPSNPAYKKGKAAAAESKSAGGAIVAAGEEYGGTGGGRYVSGGGHQGVVKPGSALDCSGFVFQSLTAAGLEGVSDGTAADQYQQFSRGHGPNWMCDNVGVENAQPGDAVYYNTGAREQQPGHCGIVASGRGRSARVMQYSDPQEGSHETAIAIYPVMGVFRFTLIKKGAGGKGGSGGNPYGPPTAPAGNPADQPGATTTKKKHHSITSGDNLLPEKLRNKINRDANAATMGSGADVTKALEDELHDLEVARNDLEQKLKTAKGKQKAAIEQEIRKINSQIAQVHKAVQASIANSISGPMAKLISDADAAFEKQTQDYIDNVLAKKYFQGTDENGNARQTPAEAQLAAMQAQDQQQSLQDALTQAQQQLATDQANVGTPGTPGTITNTRVSAGDKYNAAVDLGTSDGGTDGTESVTQQQIDADKQAVEQAERAIAEDKLSTLATQQRAQADAGYAKAVKTYQAERSKEEKALNAHLRSFEMGLEKGTKKLSDLAAVLSEFGLSGKGGQLHKDLSALTTALVGETAHKKTHKTHHRTEKHHIVHVRPEDYKNLAKDLQPYLDSNVTLKIK
jgi:hypothetical protein